MLTAFFILSISFLHCTHGCTIISTFISYADFALTLDALLLNVNFCLGCNEQNNETSILSLVESCSMLFIKVLRVWQDSNLQLHFISRK